MAEKINLTLPRHWNECSISQLEIISRIMVEQIARVDRYHPFDMKKVKIACFFILSEIEVVENPDESLPLDKQCYLCRRTLSAEKHFERRRQKEEIFPLYLWQLNFWLSSKPKTNDRSSAEYIGAGAGLLDWLENDKGSFLTRFPYPTLRLRRRDKWLRKKIEFMGVPADMDGFSWKQYRFATDLMGQYIQLSNNLIKMQKMKRFTEEKIAQQIENVDSARAMFLATIFNRRIDFIDSNTHIRKHDFHYESNQCSENAAYFRHFPDYRWQLILFWWTGMMHTLSRRFPHVFKVQKLDKKQPSTPLEIYTATTATMQKYAGLTEDQVNNQSYSLVLEHLERLSKENEEMERIRKSK